MWRQTLACLAATLLVAGCVAAAPDSVLAQSTRFDDTVVFDSPSVEGGESLEAVLAARRSVRAYGLQAVPTEALGQLLWAGQGITNPELGYRTTPSAGALYPLELYALTADEFSHYLPAGHRIESRSDTSSMKALRSAAFDQSAASAAPLVIIISGVRARTERKYGALADELMNREAGHAAQNVLLQSVALGLVGVPIGGFDSKAVSTLLALPPGEEVLYLIPIGFPPN